MGCIRSTIQLLAVTLAWQVVLTMSEAMDVVASTTKEDESFVDNFWQSVDRAPSSPNNSLEWMTESIEIFPSTTTSLRKRSSLQTKHKEHVDDFHWPSASEVRHRMIMRCKPEQEQEDCLSELLQKNPNRIKIVHDLKAIHAFSIEVDTETRDNLFADNFELHRDYIRTPLVVREESTVGDARNLKKGQTESWGFEAVRARQVWSTFGVKGRGVKVCILDTGVDASHEDFEDLTMNGYQGNDAVDPWYEDNRGHGTHITGIIAASNNDLGTV
jgi:hypothetical protein